MYIRNRKPREEAYGLVTGTPGRTRTLNTRFWRPMLYQLNYWRMYVRLASLFVHGVLTAPRAILLDLHAIRHVRLVLGRRVVATLALGAGKCNESTHVSETSMYRPIRARWYTLSNGLRPCQCLFANDRSSADTFHNLHKCWHRHEKPGSPKGAGSRESISDESRSYSMMVLTMPEPTVWPPSRIAKRRPSSMAIGWMRSPSMVMWSPGMAISVPSGSLTVPVTSVVRK